MAFINGQEYKGKDGAVGIWNSQTGCFHVVEGEISTKYTAAEFGLEVEEPVNVEDLLKTED